MSDEYFGHWKAASFNDIPLEHVRAFLESLVDHLGLEIQVYHDWDSGHPKFRFVKVGGGDGEVE